MSFHLMRDDPINLSGLESVDPASCIFARHDEIGLENYD
jgi:hypothetical protein